MPSFSHHYSCAFEQMLEVVVTQWLGNLSSSVGRTVFASDLNQIVQVCLKHKKWAWKRNLNS